MPIGGLSMFGAGLQLQQVTPGVANNGNANINGVMIARQFTTAPLGTGISSAPEVFGHNLTVTGTNQNKVVFGNSLTDGGGANQVAIFGYNSQATGLSNVALGISCSAGPVPSTGFGNNVAIGTSCVAGNTAGDGGNRVAMGYQCSASGGQNVAVGRSVNLATSNVAGADSVGFGASITLTAGATRNALFGLGIAAGAKANVLAVGYYDGIVGNFPTSGAGAQNNSIIIGNGSQTSVKIGPYQMGQSSGTVALVADANHVMTSTEGTVGWNSITAARTNTLPLAASVPAGYIARVGDFSGAASGVNSITTNPSGTDTIVGPGTPTVTTGYGWDRFMSDGVSKWICNNNL